MFLGIPAVAGHDTIYRVTRNGRDIGGYKFSIEDRAGRREVAVKMAIKVKLLFVTVYSASHDRREVWENGRLEYCAGESTYNGNNYVLSLNREGGRCLWRVNGTEQELTDPVISFVPWRPAVTGKVTLLSEKGRADGVTVAFVGRETIQAGDHAIEMDKYQMTGRRNEELWYDQQGVLQRVRYERQGAIIEIRLAPAA
ncbi:MAG: DUF6134 family protein [Opitutaceae bacterium]|nr:DUF6134 family protein [Opitutaceae bacterium]